LQSQLAASGWPYRTQASVSAPPAAPAHLTFHRHLQGGTSAIVVSWAAPAAGQPVPTGSTVTGSGCAVGRSAVAVTAAGAAIALAGPALAAPAWVITPTVNPSPLKVAFSNQFNAVSARTSTDAWAVGNYIGPNDDDGQVMLAEHWNGTAWSQVPTPNVVRFDEKLNGVVEIAPNDVRAVGGTSDLTGFQPARPIAMHWNGTAWSLTSLSNLGNGGLASVTASSSTSVWATGTVGTTSVLHWNGTSWTPETTPVGPDGQPVMTDVSAVPGSATEVWAVGFTLPSGGGYHTFAIHHP
jgi:hypothetical protein